MRAVASEAGVNLASIVYYFENKEGLYLAVYRQYAEPLMKARMKMLKEADLHPSLRAYARAFIEPAFRLFLDESGRAGSCPFIVAFAAGAGISGKKNL